MPHPTIEHLKVTNKDIGISVIVRKYGWTGTIVGINGQAVRVNFGMQGEATYFGDELKWC